MKEDDMVDLEQFREAIYSWRADAIRRGGNSMCTERAYYLMAKRIEEADRLLSIIDSAGGVECAGLRVVLLGDAVAALSAFDDGESFPKVANALDGKAFRVPAAPHQPAPVVDDAMVQRALNAKVRNWPVRQLFDSDYEARIAMRAALTVALSPRHGP